MSSDQTHLVPAASDIIPGRYRLDPASTKITFSARKLGIFTIKGSMLLKSGAVEVAENLNRSTAEAILSAESFHTPMAKRDEHVKSKRLLDVASFPTVEFRSTGVERVRNAWRIAGCLGVHGQTAPITLTVDRVSTDGDRLEVGATARVDRRVFGVTAMKAAASALIDVRIDAVAVSERE